MCIYSWSVASSWQFKSDLLPENISSPAAAPAVPVPSAPVPHQSTNRLSRIPEMATRLGFFLILGAIGFLFLLSSGVSGHDQPFYLHQCNFSENVISGNRNQSKLHFVFFAQQNCHFCYFSDIYIKFVREYGETWKSLADFSIVKLGPNDVQLFRKYRVTSVPEMVMFWFDSNDSDLGTIVPLDYDVPTTLSIHRKLLDVVEWKTRKNFGHSNIPAGFPYLPPLDVNSIDVSCRTCFDQWDTLFNLTGHNPKPEHVMLVVEPRDYPLGKQLIVQFARHRARVPIYRKQINAYTNHRRLELPFLLSYVPHVSFRKDRIRFHPKYAHNSTVAAQKVHFSAMIRDFFVGTHKKGADVGSDNFKLNQCDPLADNPEQVKRLEAENNFEEKKIILKWVKVDSV